MSSETAPLSPPSSPLARNEEDIVGQVEDEDTVDSQIVEQDASDESSSIIKGVDGKDAPLPKVTQPPSSSSPPPATKGDEEDDITLAEVVLEELNEQVDEQTKMRKELSGARSNFEETSKRLQDIMRYQRPLSYYAQTFGVQQGSKGGGGSKAFDSGNPVSHVEDVIHARRQGMPKAAYSVAEIRRLQAEVEEQHRAAIGIKKEWKFDRNAAQREAPTGVGCRGAASKIPPSVVRQQNKLWSSSPSTGEEHTNNNNNNNTSRVGQSMRRPPPQSSRGGGGGNTDIVKEYDAIERRYAELDREERGVWYRNPLQTLVDLLTTNVFNKLPLRWRVYLRAHRTALCAVFVVFMFNHRLINNLAAIVFGRPEEKSLK